MDCSFYCIRSKEEKDEGERERGHVIVIKKHKGNKYLVYDSNGFSIFNLRGQEELEKKVVTEVIKHYAMSWYKQGATLNYTAVTDSTTLLKLIEELLSNNKEPNK